MDKLKITNKSVIPLKALPSDEDRSRVVLNIGVWLDGLLSLDGDKSVRRLEVLLPIIKEEAWGFSEKEIKEAFTMYVKSDLMYNGKVIEPIDNFLTVILFNKVIQGYREAVRNRKKLKEIDYDEEKRKQDFFYVISLFESYMHSNKLPKDCSWCYDYLEERLDDFHFTKKQKQTLMKLGLEQKLDEIDARSKAKKVLLARYFDRIIAKSINLKDLIEL
jgi:hypothetical protein